MKRCIVIPARYGAKRLPGKPLRDLCGRPLLAWVLEGASKSKLKEKIFVATDDERIKKLSESLGFETILTGKEIGSGTERVFEAIKKTDAEYIVNLQADEPFIRGEMIDMIFSELTKGSTFVTLARVSTDNAELADPDKVKVVLSKDGYALYFSRSPIPYPRGKTIPYYIHIGIYGFRRDGLERYVKLERGLLEEVESLEQLRLLENGYKIKVLLTEYEGFGIDTEEDLKRAEEILKKSRRVYGEDKTFSP